MVTLFLGCLGYRRLGLLTQGGHHTENDLRKLFVQILSRKLLKYENQC